MTQPAPLDPPPTRAAGLERLAAFTPAMGRKYATERNYDFGPERRENVSLLSPYVRHRLVLERELAEAALSAHAFSTAEKFIQEVCWRTYWKGWLEMRPAVWADYQAQLRADLGVLEKDGAARADYEAALEGRTGLEPFDVWARELVETGYLHNHTRMWFASIWIFTLGLPWALGADFFLRHLLDGDPASNTLSWRWVGGLQTRGKTYLARASNIHKYTDNRFEINGYDLAGDAPPLAEDPGHPEPRPVRASDPLDRAAPSALLLTDEDLHPESWGVDGLDVRLVLAIDSLAERSPLGIGERARAFTQGAVEDGLARAGDLLEAIERARAAGGRQVITAMAHAGPLDDHIRARCAIRAFPSSSASGPGTAPSFPMPTRAFSNLRKRSRKCLARWG